MQNLGTRKVGRQTLYNIRDQEACFLSRVLCTSQLIALQIKMRTRTLSNPPSLRDAIMAPAINQPEKGTLLQNHISNQLLSTRVNNS